MTFPFQLTGLWLRIARHRELRRLWHIPPRTNPTLTQAALSRQTFTNQSSRRQNDQQRQKRPMPPAAAPDQSTPVPSTIGSLDVLGDVPVPATAIDFCYYDGFMLNSGKKVTDGDGVLLYGGEAFRWRPWVARDGAPSLRLLDERGLWDGPKEAFGVFEGMWPRPDLLVIGTGPDIRPLSPQLRKYISELGIRVDVVDTRNAAAQYNLLATERGEKEVAAALLPFGWKEGRNWCDVKGRDD